MNVRNFIMYDIQQLYCGDNDEPNTCMLVRKEQHGGG